MNLKTLKNNKSKNFTLTILVEFHKDFISLSITSPSNTPFQILEGYDFLLLVSKLILLCSDNILYIILIF